LQKDANTDKKNKDKIINLNPPKPVTFKKKEQFGFLDDLAVELDAAAEKEAKAQNILEQVQKARVKTEAN